MFGKIEHSKCGAVLKCQAETSGVLQELDANLNCSRDIKCYSDQKPTTVLKPLIRDHR
ncbi:hypothetical protein MES5069_1050005 [Mesorhizobium escarrei]|uniref:Uncharacterized protein n=1 Tax=Mesorhizobium escarrei TaxID=666018 RepID=A0ABM9DHG0_9HYPH|nr:hypothetical protein MES5069_1050005 [Mesorhizobium escarrei]